MTPLQGLSGCSRIDIAYFIVFHIAHCESMLIPIMLQLYRQPIRLGVLVKLIEGSLAIMTVVHYIL